MLDENRFEEIYDSLRGISEYDADILTGQAYGEMAEEAGIPRARRLSDAVSMQAAAADFRERARTAEEAGGDPVAAFAESALRERLAPYPEAKRKALMISMLEVSGQPLGERERMQLAQAEEKAVERRLTEEILRLARASWQETEREQPAVTGAEPDSIRNPEHLSADKAAGEQPAAPLRPGTFRAGAAAGAACLSSEALRSRPAFVGAVTGAVTAAAGAGREEGGRPESSADETLERISRILLMISAAIVLGALFALSSGAALTAAADLAAEQRAEIRTDICASLRESAQLFEACLKIAWGTAAAGLAAEALSRLCARPDESPVPAGIDMEMDMEELPEEELSDLEEAEE